MIALILVSFIGSGDIVGDKCDLIEVNHFFDDDGRHVFDQQIFFDWSPAAGRYQVRGWRLIKSSRQHPEWMPDGSYRIIWQDGEILRKVRAASVRESWTQYDPELLEREYLPKEHRTDLTQPKCKK